jgi:hypothetical protein
MRFVFALFQAMLVTGMPSVRLQVHVHSRVRPAGGRVLRIKREELCSRQ